MSNWTGGALTAAGRKLQAKAEAGTTLKFTCMKLGDGSEKDTDDLTDLKNAKLSIPISSITTADNLCKVTALLQTRNITAGFYAREWGLFAEDPDAGEILYMICLDSAPDYVPPEEVAVKESATFTMNVVVGKIASITVNIPDDALATVAMVDKCLKKTDAANTYLARADLLNVVYPVGAVYSSTASTSPAVLFGGMWQALPAGRVLIGEDSASSGTSFYMWQRTA